MQSKTYCFMVHTGWVLSLQVLFSVVNTVSTKYWLLLYTEWVQSTVGVQPRWSWSPGSWSEQSEQQSMDDQDHVISTFQVNHKNVTLNLFIIFNCGFILTNNFSFYIWTKTGNILNKWYLKLSFSSCLLRDLNCHVGKSQTNQLVDKVEKLGKPAFYH